MTEISQLVARIGIEPTYLSQIDWTEETDWFSKERIKQIITRIADNRTCNLIVEYIINNWYLACLGEPFDSHSSRSLMEQISWADDEWDWRFCNSQADSSFKDEYSIEFYIAEVCGIREEMLIRKRFIKDLDDKAKQLTQEKPKILYEEDGEVFEVNGEDVVMFHLDRQNRWMKEQLEVFEKKISSLESDYKSLEEKYKKDVSEWEEKAKALNENIKNVLEQTKTESIRDFVEQIIKYAESFPSNQNEKAEVIKEVLSMKYTNGHIPSEVLTPELRERLTNLGRKENHVQIGTLKTENLYDVHDNKTVKL